MVWMEFVHDFSAIFCEQSQLDGLAAILGGRWRSVTMSALGKLQSIVDDNEGHECELGSFERFEAFYKNYLDTSDKKRAKLAKSPRKFPIAHGVRLSGQCRLNMVKVLLEESPMFVAQ